MDYEKLHKDTINKLQQMVNSGKITAEIARGICADFVPESEDERIRKSLADYFAKFKPDYMWDEEFSFGDIVAWLEKQGGHAKFINGIQVGDKVTRNEDGVLFNLSQLNRVAKKQGEQILANSAKTCKDEQKPIDKIQIGKKYKCIASPRYSAFITGKIYKPEDEFLCGLMNFCSDCFEPIEDGEQNLADKVEQKFKVGDWVVDKNGIVRQILSYKDGVYKHTDGYSAEIFEDKWRLWDITKDAKDGDVLINDFHLIFIFKEIKDNMYISHCSIIDRSNDVIINSIADREVGDVNLVKCYPATKEQRDLLFQKMHEAGYEWDADKLELRKIEQKPAEWSEEDERIRIETIELLETANHPNKMRSNGKPLDFTENINWLKSLKERFIWRPSDEQMEALEHFIVYHNGSTNYAKDLEELRLQLKKLMEE